MNRLEELLRDAFAVHENEVPDPGNLVAAMQDRSMHRRSKWATGWLMPAVYAALVVGVAAFAIVRFTGSSQRVPITPATGPAVPAGMQPVSFHGVQIFVPASWPAGSGSPCETSCDPCDTSVSNSVVLPGVGSVAPTVFCTHRPDTSKVTIVEFHAADSLRGQQLSPVATQPVTVDEHPGLRGVGVPKGETTRVTVLVLPDPGVIISVASPDDSTTQSILDSTRVVPIDSYGCADHVEPLTPSGPSERSGSSREMVPGAPTSAVVCLYSGNWLGHSVRLSTEQMSNLRTILNALPPGVSQPGPGFDATEDACREEARRGFVVRFAYDSGPGLDVYVHISSCADLSASNGSRTTKINEPLVTLLTNVAGYDSGFPDPSELR